MKFKWITKNGSFWISPLCSLAVHCILLYVSASLILIHFSPRKVHGPLNISQFLFPQEVEAEIPAEKPVEEKKEPEKDLELEKLPPLLTPEQVTPWINEMSKAIDFSEKTNKISQDVAKTVHEKTTKILESLQTFQEELKEEATKLRKEQKRLAREKKKKAKQKRALARKKAQEEKNRELASKETNEFDAFGGHTPPPANGGYSSGNTQGYRNESTRKNTNNVVASNQSTEGEGQKFQAAKLKSIAPLEYPHFAEKMGYEGVVTLRIQIGASGQVLEAEVFKTSGYPVLDKAAQQQIFFWRFEPATRGDRPIASWIRVPIRFQIPS